MTARSTNASSMAGGEPSGKKQRLHDSCLDMSASAMTITRSLSANKSSFAIDVTQTDGEADPRTVRGPLIGGVLVEVHEVDPSAPSVLVIRCSGWGLSSRVGIPTKLNEWTTQMHVVRQNKLDLAEWLHANNSKVTEDDLAQYRKEASGLLMNKFGAHMGYEVLNTAFRALVPLTERWTVTMRVLPPYTFGEMDDSIVFCDSSMTDILVSLPLIKEAPNAQKVPAVLVAKSN